MSKRYFYLCFFDTEFSMLQGRTINYAATQKITYVLKVLSQLNISAQLVCPSWTKNRTGVYSGININFMNHKVKYFSTFGDLNCTLLKYVKCLSQLLKILFYLLIHTSRNDTLIVYHSLEYMMITRILKSVKKLDIIYEVEELYSSLNIYKKYAYREEMNLGRYNNYIMSTELLKNKFFDSSKKYAILYGSYENINYTKKKFNDHLIHLVYAGTLDLEKGGAYISVELARFLPQNYVIHILGFGNDEQKEYLAERICAINKLDRCKVIFEGEKHGEEYYDFLSKCQIGLSCQKTEGSYNDTSFPSKILVYLIFDLQVVASRIPVLEKSKIKNCIHFCEDNLESIAKKIINNKRKETKAILSQIENDFIIDLKSML